MAGVRECLCGALLAAISGGCKQGGVSLEGGELPDTGPGFEELDMLGGMVLLPAGSFTMGSPEHEAGRESDEDQHLVTLTGDLWFSRFEITQAIYEQYSGDSPSEFGDCGADCPVESVDWNQAAAFANAVSEAEGLEPCYACGPDPSDEVECRTTDSPYNCPGYRLPTEAEWEYAARAGGEEAFFTGGQLTENICDQGLALSNDVSLESLGWYCANSDEQPHPVGALRANAWTLHDVVGNAWEWCHDAYWAYEGDATDPVGNGQGVTKVVRGGSWDSLPRKLRLANRGSESAQSVKATIGVRLVRSED